MQSSSSVTRTSQIVQLVASLVELCKESHSADVEYQ
jgi:hypothetical protein